MGENCQKPVGRVTKTGSSSTPKPQVRPCNGCGLGVFQGRLFRCACCVLAQDPGLLQLLVQRVVVIEGAGEAARADHQALFVRDGHADLHPELVGLARLALADALHFGRVQGIEFVLAIGLLSMDALGALHQRVQILQRRRRGLAGLPDLALHLAQYDAQERALAFEDLAQALELPGMGVAAGFAPQRLGFFGEGLLERDARALGRHHQLVPRVLHQAPIQGNGGLAFSCTMVSTISRSNSAGTMALEDTAVSMVALSSSSTPASPMAARKRPTCVASQGRRGS
ncbi:NagN [Xanthomonas oryzae pv. oryzae KACC 10331]|uniref:NagN n=1 Tax=Xanthomonas oryzae pv. oryzae (strain KACC10331 / KXO85) TaxID=291331 RepID=Q5H6M7_XANOR|nr:NagN [Xanthomonas oryzae pv. oryzae KACC 10331]